MAIVVVLEVGHGDDVFVELESDAREGHLADAQPGQAGPAGARRTRLIRDAVGRLIEKRCGKQISRYQYDRADRLSEATRLQVQADGQEQPLHSVRFAYDKRGRIVSETSTDLLRGHSHTLSHEHDTLGNRIRTALPALPGKPTRTLHYLHYGSGHLHQIRLSLDQGQGTEQSSLWHVVADLERDDLHREILRSQGALATRYQLDPLGRRLGSSTGRGADEFGIANGPPGTPGNYRKTYRYDPVGELREASHPLKGHTRYDYDPTGRLEAVLRQNHVGQAQERFAYDPAGNLIDASLGEGRGHLRDNRVRVFEDKRYAYDGLGRLIEKRSGKHTRQRFEWDDEDRLVSVTTTRRPGTAHETTQSTRFDYDALGRRIGKTDAFGRTDFIWEGMRLIEERRGAHASAYLYEPGSYVPLARIDAGGHISEAGGLGTTQDAPRPANDAAQGIATTRRPSVALARRRRARSGRLRRARRRSTGVV